MFKQLILSQEEREKSRKVAQNARIINRDFPWLWTIRNNWCPNFMDVVVTNGYENPNLYIFLNSKRKNEIWVRYGSYNCDESTDCLTVKRIADTPEWDVNWAARIGGGFFSGYDILDLVLIIPPKKQCPEKMIIYRIKKKDRYNFRIKITEFRKKDIFSK